MKFANHDNRLLLVRDDAAIDVAAASESRLPSAPAEALHRWPEVVEWARATTASGRSLPPLDELGAPSPEPSQVFAIGLNYAVHAAESGLALPDYPFVFTKTTASLMGPSGVVPLPSATVDWEVEIVVVVGRRADRVPAADAWNYVAGLTAGQDFSDREVQNRLGVNSQPTLGKSRTGFGPTGPFLVTPDEFDDPDDLELATVINGVDAQRGRSSALIFDIATLIEYVSSVIPLNPGDLVFTGTPAGVGIGRTPPEFLKPGDVVETYVEGVGHMRHTAV